MPVVGDVFGPACAVVVAKLVAATWIRIPGGLRATGRRRERRVCHLRDLDSVDQHDPVLVGETDRRL